MRLMYWRPSELKEKNRLVLVKAAVVYEEKLVAVVVEETNRALKGVALVPPEELGEWP